jgi:hypothetical protein
MVGDQRMRMCGACLKPVYNAAAMTRRQLADLVRETEGRSFCLRMFRRPDGTLVTRRCADGLRVAASFVWLKACALVAVAIAFWTDVALLRAIFARSTQRTRAAEYLKPAAAPNANQAELELKLAAIRRESLDRLIQGAMPNFDEGERARILDELGKRTHRRHRHPHK